MDLNSLYNLPKRLKQPVSIAPLAMFRLLFGLIMFVSIVRFSLKGWIAQLYIHPTFYFTYYGFEWVKPLGEFGMYAIFFVMGIAALMVALGYYYRLAIIVFFLSFTYVELIDKTNYLNHYYFVSIVSFLLVFVPANRYFSLDVLRKPSLWVSKTPAWTVGIFILQLGIVYCFAGLAKLNPDWMLNAMPLKIWLPANNHLPLVGWFFNYTWVAYAFSWAGAFYDLTVPFFLLNRRTRPYAYVVVIVFHMLTWFMFNIGMFPFIMILCTLIFFPAAFHQSITHKLSKWGRRVFNVKRERFIPKGHQSFTFDKRWRSVLHTLIIIYFTLQFLVPLRYLLYPGSLFWTEQGFRFSWRVMLTEKTGHAIFYIKDPATGREGEATIKKYLTPNQEKMMATQPDMILQFAHFLENEYKKKGIKNPEVRVKCYVALNGRASRLFLDTTVNLANEEKSFKNKEWILPLEDYNKATLARK